MKIVKPLMSAPVTELELIGAWLVLVLVMLLAGLMRSVDWGFALAMSAWPFLLLGIIGVGRMLNRIGEPRHGR